MKIRPFLAALSVWCTLGTAPAWAAVVNATYTTGAEIPVSASSYTATGNTVNFTLNYAPVVGTQLTVVRNTGNGFINGTFSNLAQGQMVALGYNGATYRFVANYYGGTGNDLVLVWKGTRPYAWGNNNAGQLGDQNVSDRSFPVAVFDGGVLAGKTVVMVAVGLDHSLALCSDGTLAAWGSNNFGQLGNNSTTSSSGPVAVTSTGALAGKTVVAVAGGGSHSLARCSDGTVVAWGRNAQGQLGNNSTTQSNVPVAVTSTGVLAGKTVVAVAAGDSHSVALCSDGTVAAWGLNANGQLGNNNTTQSNVPVAVTSTGVLAGKTVVAVTAGDFFSAALCSDGTVATWGNNASGQLGNNSTTQSNVPVAVTNSGVLAGKTVVAVALGSGHSVARCSDGTVVAWGSNGNGQLGNNSTTNSSVPVAVSTAGVLAGKSVVTVGGGRFHSLAFCSDGTGAAWGLNGDGQLGNNSTTSSSVPVAVTSSTLPPGERFIGQFSGARGSHNLALVAAPQSNNADLSGLVVSAGTLTPTFTPAGTSYSVNVPNTTTSLTLTPTVAQADATVTVNEMPVASGSPSGPIALAPGSNMVTTQVTAQNGATKNYTVTVTRTTTLTATYNSASDVPVTSSGWTAWGSTVNFSLNFAPQTGTQLTVVRNTGVNFIEGTFGNLAQGQLVALTFNGTNYNFVANYYGGTGNDLVLVWKGTRPYAWGGNESGALGNNSTIDSAVPLPVDHTGVLAGQTVFAVAAGGSHSLALCSDGTLAAWGSNQSGQLGNNSTAASPVPVAVTSTGVLAGKTVIAVAAGAGHSLALCSDGTVAAWGDNFYGQLGNNSTTQSNVPVAVTNTGALAGKTVVAVAAGSAHSVARCSDGTVAAWGYNGYGGLGNNSTTHSPVPVAVIGTGVLAGKTVVGVAAGDVHSVAVCSDGTVAAWGRNQVGQLGNNSTTQSNVPVAVTTTGVLAGKTVVAVATGGLHTLALCSDGTLAAWGYNSYGQLGNSNTTNSAVPVAVTSTGVLAGKTVAALASGALHTLGLCSDGTLTAWGRNNLGQLGNNSLTDSSVPVAVSSTTLPAGARFIGLRAGGFGDHSLALVARSQSNNADLSGLVVSAGSLTPSFSPAGTSYTVSVPNAVSSLTLTPTAAQAEATIQVNSVPVASGSTSGSIALALGSNTVTTLVTAPDGVTTKTYTVTVTRATTLAATYNSASDVPLTANGWTATGSTVDFTLNFAPQTGTQLTVLKNTGNAFIQGAFDNLAQGQLVALAFNGATYNFVANYYGGTGNDLVLVWKGTRPYAWGTNNSGQLGNNATTDSPVPVAVTSTGVLAGKTVTMVAAGIDFSLALCSDGTLAAWGTNSSGQFGNGGTTSSSVPVAVPGSGALAGKTVVAVAAGSGHSLALCSDGTVASWGLNARGQLGNSSTTQSSVPVAVTGTGALAGKTVVGVAAGDNHSLARCSDGTVVTWGSNTQGQLGNNSTTQSNVPVAVTSSGVLAGKTVTALAGGGVHSVALCADGTVAAWGRNLQGQLGNSSNIQSNAPVAVTSTGVLAGKTVVAVAAGDFHSAALCSDGTLAAWGNNGEGELGNGSTTNSNVPVAVTNTGVLAGKTAVALATGGLHTLALCSDGTLTAWGYNAEGELGNNSLTDSSVPVAVTTSTLAAGGRFTGLHAGALGTHSLALVAAPQSNNANLSGLVVSAGTLTPAFTPGGTSYTISVSNAVASLTLTPTAAQADATIQVNNVPVASGSASGLITLAPGSNTLTTLVTAQNGITKTYTVTVTRASALVATFNSASDVPVTSSGWTATGSTVNFTLNFAPTVGTQLLVVRNTGNSFISGTFSNLAQGQTVTLGYNGTNYNFVANYYGGTGNDLVLVWKGTRPYAWGGNKGGELGNNSATDSPVPVAVDNTGVLAGRTVLAVAVGSHSLALCADGEIAAWGANYAGQLGDNSTTDSPVPVAVTRTGVLAGKTVVAVGAGDGHSLALCSDGTVAAWGDNFYGQLGNGSTTNSSVPVAVTHSGVLAGKTVVAVAAGSAHSLALCSDGTVAAWGYNAFGGLGNNSTTHSSVPVAVTSNGILAGKTVVALAAGDAHSVAVCSDGTLASWGRNDFGQLGNNTTTQSTVPVAVTSTGVLAGKSVTAATSGQNYNIALCSDGTVVAWGLNQNGQLGNNSLTNSSVPVAVTNTGVLAGRMVVAMAAGGAHGLALCADGTLTAWGWNSVGQLGNGTTTGSSVPVAVTSSTLPAGGRFVGLFTGSPGSNSLALVAAPQSSNADLSGLVVSAGTLSPSFTAAGISYTVSVPTVISSLTLTPTAAQADATIQVNNVPVASGSPSGSIALALGSNTLTTLVTAQNGTTKTYTVTVTRDTNFTVTYNSASDVGLTVGSYSATGSTVNFTLNYAPTVGTQLLVVKNTGTGFINGTFDNLAQGQTVVLTFNGATYNFVANYYGGTGNDLVLVWKGTRPYAWGTNNSGQLGNNATTDSPVPVAVTSTGVLAGKTVTMVAAGIDFSLALCSDGTLAAWGTNSSGQFGNGSTTSSSVPVAVPGSGALAGKTVVAVAAGAGHSLALCSDGTVASWGLNARGQLGNSSTTQSSVPVAVTSTGALAGKTVVGVAAGDNHSLARCSDGTVVTWGSNTQGQLGNNATSDSPVPVAVTSSGVLAGKTVVALAGGGVHSVALCADGTVAAWGRNLQGQLGNSSNIQSNVPVAVTSTGVLAGKTVVAVAAGDFHSAALCSDGTLAAWGNNGEGELGNGSTTNSNVPVAVTNSGVLAGKTAVALATGGLHTLALCSDGTLTAWGYNGEGELGNNSLIDSSVPVAVTSSTLAVGGRFIGLHAGALGSHSLALVATPPSSNANLSNLVVSAGTLTPSFTPAGISYTVSVPNTTTSLTLTPTAAQAEATIQVNNVPVASGSASGPIALAPGSNTLTTLVTAQNGATKTYTVTVNRDTTLVATYNSASDVPATASGWTATGSLVNFTLNFAPAVGTQLLVVKNTGNAFISGTFSNLAQGQTVTLGYNGTNYNFVANYYGGTGNDLVLVWQGTRPYAWGGNSDGQLGDNSTADRREPVAVTSTGILAGKTVVMVAVGQYHSVALCSDGTLAAWGLNSNGQFGNGSTTSSSVPVAVDRSGVLAGKTVVAVAAGARHSLVLCHDGTVAAWGLNANGQLGNNSTTDSSVPVIVTTTGVLSGKTVVAVASGGYHGLALCSDGTLAAWGRNDNGGLGNNSTVSSAVPVAVTTAGVLSGKTVAAVAAGYLHSLALCSDGTLASWGLNGEGQLGNNSTTNSSVPVAMTSSGVLAGKTVVALAAGDSHSLALCSDGTVAACGRNSSGQLGNNSTTQSTVPVAVVRSGVLAGRTVQMVAAGLSHSVALCSDGTIATWGQNTFGQLGDGSTTTTRSTVPVAVSTSFLAAGERFTGLFSGCEGLHSLALVAPSTPIVTTPTAASLTATTALLGGTVNLEGNGAITARGVVVAPTAVNANPQLGGPGVQSTAGSGTLGAFSVLASNLNPGTAYTFAAYATNGLGTSYSATGTFTTLTGVEYWRQTWYGSAANTGNGADAADPYATGVPNLLVFALLGPAQDPALARVSQLPQPELAGGNLSFSFTQPGGVSGVTYGAEWCPALDLGNWQPVADTGTGGQHIFSVPAAGNAKVFLRLKVTSP